MSIVLYNAVGLFSLGYEMDTSMLLCWFVLPSFCLEFKAIRYMHYFIITIVWLLVGFAIF